MSPDNLLYPLLLHLVLVVLLYSLLTLFRAPSVWNIGARQDGSNPWEGVETRVSANLSNQFEWPVFFYAICVLLISRGVELSPVYVWLAWIFIAGRLLHTGVQVLTTNIRLRGVVFTINFLAVLAMWGLYFVESV